MKIESKKIFNFLIIISLVIAFVGTVFAVVLYLEGIEKNYDLRCPNMAGVVRDDCIWCEENGGRYIYTGWGRNCVFPPIQK